MRDTKDYRGSLALIETADSLGIERVNQWAARAAKEWAEKRCPETPSMQKYREAFAPRPAPSKHWFFRLLRAFQAEM